MRFRKVLDVVVCIFAIYIVASTTLIHYVKAVQPPVDTSTLVVGRVNSWLTFADPVMAYDRASCEIISNVYDTLITFKGEIYWEFEPSLAWNVPSKAEGTIVDITKTVTSIDVDLTAPIGSTWSDGSTCIGWVDNHANGELDATDVMYMIEADGSYRTWQVQSLTPGATVSATLIRQKWIFHIRTTAAGGNPIYFVNERGSIVDTFDVYDAEYSFKRGLVQDQLGSPMWMFYKPFFDQMNSDPFDSNTAHPTAMDLAHLIDNAVEVSGDDLILNLGMIFPEISFKQILSQTWASMVSKEFSISIGCWNGDLYTDADGDGYPNWWFDFRRWTSGYDKDYYNLRYVGTGPYIVEKVDHCSFIILRENIWCWRGWPHLSTIIIENFAYWEELRDAFLCGDVDICDVDLLDWATTLQLLDPVSREPKVPGIITIKNIQSLDFVSLHFTFTVDPSSPYVPRRYDTFEPLPNFFNNTHVRKAFCYAINHTMLIKDALQGEAIWRNNMLVYGLVPDYYDPTIGGYDINREKAIQHLKEAVLPDGKSVWEAGFYLDVACSELVGVMLQDFFCSLGPQFHIHYEVPSFSVYFIQIRRYQWPVWQFWGGYGIWGGWCAADVDGFTRLYMHSYGNFAYFQNYTYWNGWGSRKDELIDLALKTPDGPARAALYKELEQIYFVDAPSLPLVQPIRRRWQWYWVKGWYYNPAYLGGDNYYSMYKKDTCWFNISGPTWGIPDDVTNLRDVTYLILHFNAKAPEPGKPPDPKWVGTYGFGGVDPYGDRVCNMRDVAWTILHFNHRNQP